jgi:hypothetical protein
MIGQSFQRGKVAPRSNPTGPAQLRRQQRWLRAQRQKTQVEAIAQELRELRGEAIDAAHRPPRVAGRALSLRGFDLERQPTSQLDNALGALRRGDLAEIP